MRNILFLFFCVSNLLFSRDVVFVKLSSGSGIGNQMFQVAAAFNLAKRIGADLKVMAPNAENAALKDPNDRKYILNKKDFHLNGVDFIADGEPNTDVWIWDLLYNSDVKGKGTIFVGGYFESEIFFKESAKTIKKMFALKNTNTPFIKKHLTEIKKYNSVAVHIRRGDFKNYPERMLPISYYANAMQMFAKQENVKFFVFSDDPAFVKDCFFNMDNLVVVSDGTATNLEEFYLMTQCKNLIIANSTFSWWAAYLCDNPDATIVAPFPKFKDAYFTKSYPSKTQQDCMRWVHCEEPYPKHWKTIDPFS